jgi:hypothetical protein
MAARLGEPLTEGQRQPPLLEGRGLSIHVLPNLLCPLAHVLTLSTAMQVGDALCAGIAELHQLRHLSLCGQPGVTLQGLGSLSSLQRLRSLALEGCQAICNEGLQLIARHTRLRRLSLKQAARNSATLHAGGEEVTELFVPGALRDLHEALRLCTLLTCRALILCTL